MKVKKVSAYILCSSKQGYDEILAFTQNGSENNVFEIPGGTIEKGERLKEALKREIKEETGLQEFTIHKKLGKIVYKNSTDTFVRTFFSVRVKQPVQNDFSHCVSGSGKDAGTLYNFTWLHPQETLLLTPRDTSFLSQKYLPSVFTPDTLLGLSNQTISLMPYTALWKKKFRDEKRLIQKNLQDPTFIIEHIGSTSVPGLAAKPIIDIGIGITDKTDINRFISAMQKAGYEYKGENDIEGRHYFVKGSELQRLFHVHAFHLNAPEWKSHLLFRNKLRSNKILANQYECLKIEKWKTHYGDRAAYTDSKDEFIKSVLQN
ncbi:MAG TPA: GrpB family protein [Treponemataceae bacterium]|jgi:GrpB-like predicted nucleotidyltransferase (UPF0157 family)/8-oxo-dGTP pyrophosphatase MutT (NUDIX family)|nr:GrpB family protein [Treponemataceae bacterium]